MRNLLSAALIAAECGWYVFPLRPDRPGDDDEGKRPAFPARCTALRCDRTDARCRAAGRHIGWEERATRDPGRIRRAWSARPYNVGIACGPSGLLVVDLDQPKPDQPTPQAWADHGATCGADVFRALCADAGQPVPGDTYTVRTGRGGTHLYFRQPNGPGLRNTNSDRGNGLGWLVDTRGHGGYVVAAGSTVDGRRYETLRDAEPAPLPAWLVARLTPPPPGPAAGPVHIAAGRRSAYLDTAVRGALDRVAAAGLANNHTLNTTLFGAALTLGRLVAGGELPVQSTGDALVAEAVRWNHPRGSAVRTVASGFRYGAQRPRQVSA